MHSIFKKSDISGYATRRTHRTYIPELKAELVAAYRQSGVSITALVSSLAVNANVLRRWLIEHENSGRRQLIRFDPSDTPLPISPASAFIPLKLLTVIHECKVLELAVLPDVSEFNVELRKCEGALSMIVT